jgi:hypothetical protein
MTNWDHHERGEHGRGEGRTAGAAWGRPAWRRTAAFLAAGVGLLVAGWLVQPRFPSARVEPAADRVLFKELTDASKAASLEIRSYDDELATLRSFKVLQSDGVWVLPSHENYPADAREQLAAAATALVDLPILGVVSTSPGDHETYGVIEPDPEKIKPGVTGVGRLVEVRDASGNRLARLVIGREDKRPGGMAGEKPLLFVRRAGQDPVYRVELDTSKFTTKFGDWIEKDLLKLSAWDIRRVVVDDSTASFAVDESSGRPFVSQDRRSRIVLGYDDRGAAWNLVGLEDFKDNKPQEASLADDEELSKERLDDLRNALGDLRIVDVTRKPAGLSGDLQAKETFTNDQTAVLSLAQRGFYAVGAGEIVSSNGDTVVGMKDGVEYVLRFGNSTTVAGASDDDDSGDRASGEGAPGPDGTAGEATGRYLFVMARFNEDLLEKPTLEPLPEVPGVPGDATPGEQTTQPAAETPEADPGKATAETPEGAADPDTDTDTNTDEDEEEEDEENEPATETPEAAAGQPDDAPPAPKTALGAAEEAEAKAQAALEARRRVERENRRRQEEYDAKVEAARRKVRELNARFADWYYVVPDAEYAKIRLGRADVITKQNSTAGAAE